MRVAADLTIRTPDESELDALAQLWHEGWQEAHRPILPPELAQHRTLESFRQRLGEAHADIRVVGAPGTPFGLCIVKQDELYQLYVSAAARGTGAAAVLMTDGEQRLHLQGYETVWLACAIGNERAAKFYEKHGWRRVGTVMIQVTISGGEFPLEVWRYEKCLSR